MQASAAIIKSRTLLLISIICFNFAFACSDMSNTSSKVQIIGGSVIETKGLPVAALMKPDNFSDDLYVHCSGVLLDPNNVLTAAHCVSSTAEKSGEITPYLPEEVRVQVGELVVDPIKSNSIAVSKIIPHPQYDPGEMKRDKDGLIKPGMAYDLAIVKLATPLDINEFSTFDIMDQNEQAKWLSSQRQALIYGYGLSNLWSTPEPKPNLRGATTVYRPSFSKVISKKEYINGRLITRPLNITVPGSSEIEIFLGGKSHPDTCGGDSGGPAFTKTTSDRYVLVGITSRGDPECHDGGVYTSVAAQYDWIRSQL